MKSLTLLGAILSMAWVNSYACTTIIVGKKATTDGSMIVARNADGPGAANAVHFLYHQPRAKGYLFKNVEENKFQYQMPDKLMGYSGIPDWSTKNSSFEEAGFNDLGVGISATETIYSNDKTLKVDPYLESYGIVEEAIPTILLPQIHSAREGVEKLGAIIEKTGAGEGFGVAFIDKNEAWYLENAGGHQWLAVRIPDNMYFVSANQSRLGEVDLKDSKNYLASPNLIEFAIKNGLYNPTTDGKFNFHKVYGKNDLTNKSIYENDSKYNYPRVSYLQGKYTVSTLTTPVSNGDFPVFLVPDHKLSLFDVEDGLQSYFQGTKDDPYTLKNPAAEDRPISVFRTQQSHVLVVRNKLPKAIANINYLNFGMTALGIYMPFYQGAVIPDYYQVGSNQADSVSAYWKFRKLQTLAMQDFPKYAPIVQTRFAKLRSQFADEQQAFEVKYIALARHDLQAAKQLLAKFTNTMQAQTFAAVDELTNQILTDMTNQVEKAYHYEGA